MMHSDASSRERSSGNRRESALSAKIQSLGSHRELLLLENDMYERSVAKFIPYEDTYFEDRIFTLGQKAVRSKSFRSDELARAKHIYKRLTFEEKCFLAHQFLDEKSRELAVVEKEAGSIVDGFGASLEGLSVAMKDIELGRVLFDKQVVMRTVDNRVDCAQKELVKRAFMDYHRRYMRALDEKAQRLRMENDHLLQQYRKHLSSIRSLGREGSVNPHDFFEAEIRCKKSLSQITNLVHTCSELKRHAVRCSNECRRVKHILHEKLRTIGQLEVECTRRRKAAQSLHDQIEVTAKQCSKAQKKKKHYTLVLANMSAPPVSEFVSKVGELHFLIQQLQDKRRKKELAELSLKAHRRAWSRLCQ